MVKNPPTDAGDMGSIPGSGRSPGEGSGNPYQYFCLGNPKDREAWWDTVHGVAERQDLAQHSIYSTFTEKDYPFPNMLYCYTIIS